MISWMKRACVGWNWGNGFDFRNSWEWNYVLELGDLIFRTGWNGIKVRRETPRIFDFVYRQKIVTLQFGWKAETEILMD